MTTIQSAAPEERQRPSVFVPLFAGILAGLVQPLLYFVSETVPLPISMHHLGMVSIGPIHHIGAVGILIVVGLTLVYSVVFAMLFELVYTRRSWREQRLHTVTAFGVGYAGLIWIIGSATAWPLVLRAFDIPGAPPIPHLDGSILLMHLLYGAVIGSATWALTRYP